MVGGIMALLDDDDVETALPALRLAEKTYPTHAAVYAMLGKVLARTGDRLAAANAFRRALELLPDDASVGGLRGYWQRQIERGLRELTNM